MKTVAREVTRTIPSNEVLLDLLPPFPHVEVRERRDGTWGVWYPNPAWIPCDPTCRLQEVKRDHKHDFEQGWIETYYAPTSYDDALDWATRLAGSRPVVVLSYKTLAEHRTEAARERRTVGAAA